ncbi:MAG: N-6 DNA methylase [Terracidiphilus sp.]
MTEQRLGCADGSRGGVQQGCVSVAEPVPGHIGNSPFNDSDWPGDLLKGDKRWVYGNPPAGNANYAWVQRFISHLAPTGLAGLVLANGSMSSNQSGEGEICKAIIVADLVDCMVALPGQLFFATQIPVCLWFLAKSKNKRSETWEWNILRTMGPVKM